ncbi:hypothetical protein [Natranaerobius thermophilus]|nr:hypothetical protein [Natranaerobius thermophilus]
MTYYGHCGSKLATTSQQKKYVRKDGAENIRYLYKYRCTGKAYKARDCDGQTAYAKNILRILF